MEFRILGPLEVLRDDGSPLQLRSPTQRALLAVLLLRANVPVSFEELVDEVWGARAPRTAHESLHNHALRLRRALGASRIETVGAAYRVRLKEAELDLARFRAHAARARALDAPERARALDEALACWRGVALAEFSHRPFAQGEALRLEELRLATLEERIETELELGRHEALVAELEALVARNPLRETLWRQLMLALYRSGRQADALAAYRRAHHALTHELGLEPGPALRELQRALLVQDPSLLPGASRGDDLLERAARLLPTSFARRAETLLEYAVALRRLGELPRSRAALEEAVRLGERHGRRAIAERARLLLASLDVNTGAKSLTDYLAGTRRAVHVLREEDDLVGLADALRAEGTALRDLGRADEALDVLEEAIEIGRRSGNRSAEGLSRNFLATALVLGTTPVESAIARCEDELGALSWGPPGPIGLLGSLAVLHAQAGRLERAREHLERTREDCRAAGLAGELAWVALQGAAVALLDGDLAGAEDELRLAFELTETLGYAGSVALTAPELARVRILRGDDSDTERLTALGRRLSRPDDFSAEAAWRRAEALRLAASGDERGALDLAEHAVELCRAADWLAFRAETLEDLASLQPPSQAAATLAEAIRTHELKGSVAGAERARLRAASRVHPAPS